MELATALASGALAEPPQNWPENPWALALALIPPTAEWEAWLPAVRAAKPGSAELPPEVVTWMTEESSRWGWNEDKLQSMATSEFPYNKFVRLRLAQQDVYARSLRWDPNESDAWYIGIAAVLEQLRALSSGIDISLAQFEALKASEVLQLIDQAGGAALVRQLAVPYLRYRDELVLLSEWIMAPQVPMSALSAFVDVDEAANAIYERCLDAPTSELRNVATLVPDLKEAARAAKILEVTPRSARDWSVASAITQLDVLIRFLRDATNPINWRSMDENIAFLRRSVIGELSQEDVERELVRAALAQGRFSYLSGTVAKLSHGVVRELVLEFAEELLATAATDADVQRIRASLELISDAPIGLVNQVDTLRRANSFGLSPAQVRGRGALEISALALQTHQDAYRRVTELQKLVAILDPSLPPERVQEQAVEAALAADDFEGAASLCTKLNPSSESAWIAYLQAGKYVAPFWDSPRPLQILMQQQSLLSRALESCPSADLGSALRAWEVLEEERLEAEDASVPEVNPHRDATSSLSPSIVAGRSGPPGSGGSGSGGAGGGSGPALQNLLVSGIGWAIGAPRD